MADVSRRYYLYVCFSCLWNFSHLSQNSYCDLRKTRLFFEFETFSLATQIATGYESGQIYGSNATINRLLTSPLFTHLSQVHRILVFQKSNFTKSVAARDSRRNIPSLRTICPLCGKWR